MRRRPVQLESLENRTTPVTFTVSNTLDSGLGSLRQAIADAAAAGGSNTITFAPGLAGKSIALTTNDANGAFGPTALVVAGSLLSAGVFLEQARQESKNVATLNNQMVKLQATKIQMEALDRELSHKKQVIKLVTGHRPPPTRAVPTPITTPRGRFSAP